VRTPKLSSGGLLSVNSRKQIIGPPSAAADGSAIPRNLDYAKESLLRFLVDVEFGRPLAVTVSII
jgi:hypothetical protein